MRIILFPNGAVVNNFLDVDIQLGKVIEKHISIPGYIPGTLSLTTSLGYEYTIDNNIITIYLYVSDHYGATGPTSIAISYGTTSIYGGVYYELNTETNSTTRSVVINNNTASEFEAEICVSEGTDIHRANEFVYVKVGDALVKEGEDVYPLTANIISVFSYYIDLSLMTVYLGVKMTVNGGEPIPGTLVLINPFYTIYTPIGGENTIAHIIQDAVTISSNNGIYTLVVQSPGVIHLSGVSSATIDGPQGIVSYNIYNDSIIFYVTPGTYTIK